MKIEWEHIENSENCAATHRLRVFGGWIVRTIEYEDGLAVSTVFVPDPRHEWATEANDVEVES